MTMTRPTTDQITHKGQLLSAVLDRAVNVQDFGAVGDGVTDDLSAIRAAVAYVIAQGGGTVYIPYTQNGYYVSTGIGCNLSNTSGISIISDRAEIKMQGAANINDGASATLFYGSNVSDFTMQGLVFSATSTVLRYQNGDTNFNTAVDEGSASALVQTSFRYVFSITGTCASICIDSCDFLSGIFYPISVKNGPSPGSIKNLRFTNLRFLGVNTQCIYTSTSDGVIVENIEVNGGQDCRYDHLLYLREDVSNVSVRGIQYRNTNGLAFVVTFGQRNVSLSDLMFENVTCGCIAIASASTSNVSVSNATFVNCDGSAQVDRVIGVLGGQDIALSSLRFEDCSTIALWAGDDSGNSFLSNITVRDVAVTRGGSFLLIRSAGNIVVENCTVIDTGGNINADVINNGPSAGGATPLNPAWVTFRNCDFIWSSYVPLQRPVSVTGATVTCDFENCTFSSRFGTCAVSPLTNNSAVLRVKKCKMDGFSAPLVFTFSGGPQTNEIIDAATPELVLTANSATPSVAQATMFVTANSSATAYTNFTGGVSGQEICVRVNDANTTFDFTGTSLKGNNGVDYTATSGDVIFAKRIGSNWHCTISEA